MSLQKTTEFLETTQPSSGDDDIDQLVKQLDEVSDMSSMTDLMGELDESDMVVEEFCVEFTCSLEQILPIIYEESANSDQILS